MLRSMFSGVSGLRSHQTMMDVIGNNIANVNTAGFKASSVVFQDLLSQALQGAGVPTAGANSTGGTNPAQVGLGVRVGGVVTSFNQGASQVTGRSTDLSIQGDGFFVVRSAASQLYTRAGSLSFDALGRLVTADGAVLQGWTADSTGAVDTNGKIGDIVMPLGQSLSPTRTSSITIGGNLPADAPINTATAPAVTTGSRITTSITVYDTQGAAHDVTLQFTHTAANVWGVAATMPDVNPAVTTPISVGTATLTWNPAATPPSFTSPALTITPTDPATGSWSTGATISAKFGTVADPDGLTQYAGKSSMAALKQDGSGMGALQSFSFGQDGVVTGVFSNGKTRPVGQVALGQFSNAVGLEKVGSSLYRPTVNSGVANIGVAGAGGRGLLAASSLEMSNVDLAQEFTNLIVAQRGFQANSRVITASDELLQDLVNLKR
jgi:flagellar hook protein FlgE